MAGKRPDEFAWTPAACIRLAHLWCLKANDGTDALSLSAMGMLLGVSDHAVGAKARRMALPPRASPIKRGRPRLHPPPVEPPRPPTRGGQPLPAGAGTLPPLPNELADA